MESIRGWLSRLRSLKPTSNSRYTILVAAVSAWLVSVSTVLFPTIGLTTTVYPPKPTPGYQLILLVVTACIAAGYSLYMGVRMLRAPPE